MGLYIGSVRKISLMKNKRRDKKMGCDIHLFVEKRVGDK